MTERWHERVKRSIDEGEAELASVLYRQALTYISSPTVGLPSGRDALDFVDEASEANVRLALKACIGTARAALDGT